jgi:hypothetical protein
MKYIVKNYGDRILLARLCVQNLVLCLNRELIKIIDYKFMLKLQCKTTFNSVFVGKKIIKGLNFMYRDVQQVFGHCNFFAILHTGI